MKKKIFSFIFGFLFFFIFVESAKAACTSVPSNQTTCTGNQKVTCSQVHPPAGNIDRWCCDDQVSCNEAKSGVQEEIENTTNNSNNNSKDTTCDNGKGINTAIGCLHVLDSPNTFLSEILRWATGIGGGIAFLLMLYAGFMIMTASGNPDRIQAGKELLMSAIGGLILLILSIFILKLIGIDILGLCKFGFGPSC